MNWLIFLFNVSCPYQPKNVSTELSFALSAVLVEPRKDTYIYQPKKVFFLFILSFAAGSVTNKQIRNTTFWQNKQSRRILSQRKLVILTTFNYIISETPILSPALPLTSVGTYTTYILSGCPQLTYCTTKKKYNNKKHKRKIVKVCRPYFFFLLTQRRPR